MMSYIVNFPYPEGGRTKEYWRTMAIRFKYEKKDIEDSNFSDKKNLCEVLDWAINYSKNKEKECMNIK